VFIYVHCSDALRRFCNNSILYVRSTTVAANADRQACIVVETAALADMSRSTEARNVSQKTFTLMGWRCDDKGDLGLAEQGVDSQPQL
jgi:hypothetical protein